MTQKQIIFDIINKQLLSAFREEISADSDLIINSIYTLIPENPMPPYIGISALSTINTGDINNSNEELTIKFEIKLINNDISNILSIINLIKKTLDGNIIYLNHDDIPVFSLKYIKYEIDEKITIDFLLNANY